MPKSTWIFLDHYYGSYEHFIIANRSIVALLRKPSKKVNIYYIKAVKIRPKMFVKKFNSPTTISRVTNGPHE